MKFEIVYKQAHFYEVQYKRRKKLRQEFTVTEIYG